MSKEIEDHILRLYEPKKLMGSGAYGHVWRALDRRTRTPVALKKIFDAFQNSTDAQRTYRELTLLTQLQHPNIVKLLRALRARNNRDLYLVFQLVQADLHSLVGENLLQPPHLRFIASQLLRALHYLHSAQLLHRDLKPSNLLINSQCRIKICDFGLARSLTREEQHPLVLTEEVATRWYRSPEMLLASKHYGKPTDVWSVGCILAELVIGKPLFPGDSTLEQLQKIVEFTGAPSKQSVDSLHSSNAETLLNQLSVRKRPLRDYFTDPQHNELVELILRMLEFSPARRISVEQALKHPSLAQFKEQPLLCQKFIVPPVDDNTRLTVAQYRKLIHQDIDRLYPEDAPTPHRQTRCAHSFTRTKPSDPTPERRQRSLIHPKQHTPNPVININPHPNQPKPLEPAKQAEAWEGLRRTGSRKTLVKRGGKPTFNK